jgi:hypothetical protein
MFLNPRSYIATKKRTKESASVSSVAKRHQKSQQDETSMRFSAEKISFQLHKRAWQICLMDHFYYHKSKREGLLAIFDTIFSFACPSYTFPQFQFEVLNAKQLDGGLLQLLRYAALTMYYQPSQANLSRKEFFKRLPLHPVLIQMYATAPSTGGHSQFSMFLYILTAWVTTFTKRLKQQELSALMLPSNHDSFPFIFYLFELLTLLHIECKFNFASIPAYLYIIESFLLFHRVDLIHVDSLRTLIDVMTTSIDLRCSLPDYESHAHKSIDELCDHYADIPFVQGFEIYQALLLIKLFDQPECKPWLYMADKMHSLLEKFELRPNREGFVKFSDLALLLNEDAHALVKMIYTLACQRDFLSHQDSINILKGMTYSGFKSTDKDPKTCAHRSLGLRGLDKHSKQTYDSYCQQRHKIVIAMPSSQNTLRCEALDAFLMFLDDYLLTNISKPTNLPLSNVVNRENLCYNQDFSLPVYLDPHQILTFDQVFFLPV